MSSEEMSPLRRSQNVERDSEKINTDLTVHINSNAQLKNGLASPKLGSLSNFRIKKEVLPLRTVTLTSDGNNQVGLLDVNVNFNDTVQVGSNTPYMGSIPH